MPLRPRRYRRPSRPRPAVITNNISAEILSVNYTSSSGVLEIELNDDFAASLVQQQGGINIVTSGNSNPIPWSAFTAAGPAILQNSTWPFTATPDNYEMFDPVNVVHQSAGFVATLKPKEDVVTVIP